MALYSYESSDWIRDEIDLRAEERPMRLEDAVAYGLGEVSISGGTVKFSAQAISDAWKAKDTWLNEAGYVNYRYQEALDKYMMRRVAAVVSLHRECKSSSYEVTDLVSGSRDGVAFEAKLAGGYIEKYVIASDTEKDHYRIQSFHAEDKHTGDLSSVRVTLVRYTDWRIVRAGD